MKDSASHVARKRFGQNFLVDGNIIDKIVRAINPQASDNLVEIGPGKGAITAPLIAKLDHITAIELDRDLAAMLEATYGTSGKLALYQTDALSFDFASLSRNRSLRIVGNLPYNISTPLIFHLLEFSGIIRDMHFMLQKEVVERLAAKPGNKTYGRLSVIVQYYCQVQQLFSVPPGAFQPAPKVESAIVRLIPKAEPAPTIKNPALFQHLVRSAFQQRRKTLRNTLKFFTSELSLLDGQIDLSRRPETLTVTEFAELSNQLELLAQ